MYKLYKDVDGSVNQNAVILTTNNSCIPFDPTNSDYKKYLEWVAEGNTPEPADE